MNPKKWMAVLLFAALAYLLAPGHARSGQSRSGDNKPSETKINIFSSTFGGMSYRLSFGLAEVINKNHPYIRAVARETRGSIDNQMTLLKYPDLRKNTIFNCNDLSYWIAFNGMPPFKTPYRSGRVIAKIMDVMPILFTTNKKIKTKDDLVGKRIVTLGAQHTISRMFDLIIRDIWGLGGKVKIMRGSGFADVIDSVRDGLADAGTTSVNTIIGTGIWKAVPALRELMEMKDIYFVNLTKEEVKKLSSLHNLPIVPGYVPERKIHKRQLSPGLSYTHSNEWWADVEMDEKIVYEVTKTIYEHVADFKNYHGLAKLWKAEKIGETPLPRDVYHPGALRFYREKGMM